MNRDIIVSIINGYDNQLLNATDPKIVEWLKDQIKEGHYILATQSIN